MITAHGTMTFSTRTTPADLLRSLAELVDDLNFAGINVEVQVTVGDAPATVGDAPATQPAPFVVPSYIPTIPTTPPAPVWTSTTLPPTSMTVHSNPPFANGAQPPAPPIALNWDSPTLWGALWPLVEDLHDGSATFRSLEPAARYDLAAAIARAIDAFHDAPVSQFLFDQHKPAWCPGAAGLARILGYRWPDILARWLAAQPYLTPEADDDTAPFRAQ